MKIKDNFIDLYYLARQNSSLANKESNDCVVRAIMVGFSVSYEQAHSFCEIKFKREFRKGLNLIFHFKNMMSEAYEFAGHYIVELWDLSSEKERTVFDGARQINVKEFSEMYSEGSWIIIVDNHALAIKDGIIYDNPNECSEEGFNRTVLNAFKVKNESYFI